MIKKLISMLLVVLLLGLCGCGEEQKKPKQKKQTQFVNKLEKENFNLKTYIDKNPSSNNSQSSKEKRNFYNIEATLDIKEKILQGKEKITYINKQSAELEDMALHLYVNSYHADKTGKAYYGGEELCETMEGDIKINSVMVSGKQVEFIENDEILKFKLPEKLSKDKTVELDIDFIIKIPQSSGRLGYKENNFSFTNWYPIVSMYDIVQKTWDENPYYYIGESNYADYSDYKVAVDVPKDLVVVGTGMETEKLNGDRKRVVMEEKNVKDFAFFASPLYKVVTNKVDDIEINSYYMGESPSMAERLLYNACGAMKFYSAALGKYPYKEFDIVETNLKVGAMEYPTVIQMCKCNDEAVALMNNKLPSATQLYWIDDTVVHELVHQWWFGVVGNNEFKESILDESFTTFWTTMYFEYAYGMENSRSMVNQYAGDYYMKKHLPISRAVDEYQDANLFYLNAYNSGGIVLQDLRQRIGSEKFIEVFRKYYDTFKFKNATFEGFLQVLKEQCGQETSDYIKKAFTGKDYDVTSVFEQVDK